MRKFQIYLHLSGKWDCPYVEIKNVEKIEQLDETSIAINDTIVVDFGNEIFGISELQ